MNILEEIRSDVRGLALLRDWLGDSLEPVSQMRAEHRAYACTHGDNGYPCHLNQEAGYWERAKNAVADTIRAELELKQKIGLRLSNEQSLHLCGVCRCCLRLKPFTPLEHIKAHTTIEQLNQMPKWCWMKKELEHYGQLQ